MRLADRAIPKRGWPYIFQGMSRPAVKPEVHELIAQVRQARYAGQFRCPHCAGERVRRWGSFSGRLRYRCNSCQKTFSDLTGTVFAYNKRLDLWPRFVEHIADCQTIRHTAAELDVHIGTIFRWRHMALDALMTAETTTLSGIVEMGETTFPYSQKGCRSLDRPPRKHGLGGLNKVYTIPHVCAVVACDRNGAVFSDVILQRHPFLVDLRGSVITRVAGKAVIIASPPVLSSYGKAARACGHSYHSAARYAKPDGSIHHTCTMQRYVQLLCAWLPRFRGVATRYLDHYLAWHRRLHMLAEGIARAMHDALRVPASIAA